MHRCAPQEVAAAAGRSAGEPGAVAVDFILCGPAEQERFLRERRADVALLHRPFDSTAGFDTEELGTETQVVVLPAGHPLPARPHVRMADISGLPRLPLPRWPDPEGTHPRPARARRSATTRSCCSSSHSAVPERSLRSRAEPNRTMT